MNAQFKEIVSSNAREDSIKILEFTDKVPELMTIADLVITKPRWSYNNRKFSFWITYYCN